MSRALAKPIVINRPPQFYGRLILSLAAGSVIGITLAVFLHPHVNTGEAAVVGWVRGFEFGLIIDLVWKMTDRSRPKCPAVYDLIVVLLITGIVVLMFVPSLWMGLTPREAAWRTVHAWTDADVTAIDLADPDGSNIRHITDPSSIAALTRLTNHAILLGTADDHSVQLQSRQITLHFADAWPIHADLFVFPTPNDDLAIMLHNTDFDDMLVLPHGRGWLTATAAQSAKPTP